MVAAITVILGISTVLVPTIRATDTSMQDIGTETATTIATGHHRTGILDHTARMIRTILEDLLPTTEHAITIMVALLDIVTIETTIVPIGAVGIGVRGTGSEE